MKICARCDKPILPGQDSVPVDKTSSSGGGITLHVHAELCDRALIQTAPAARVELIQED